MHRIQADIYAIANFHNKTKARLQDLNAFSDSSIIEYNIKLDMSLEVVT